MIRIHVSVGGTCYISSKSSVVSHYDGDKRTAAYLGISKTKFLNAMEKHGAEFNPWGGHQFNNKEDAQNALKELEPYILALKLKGEEV